MQKKNKKFFTALQHETELEIIEWRYGLNHKETLTQKEIAKMFHISRSYVSRIEKKALLKLYREFRKIN